MPSHTLLVVSHFPKKLGLPNLAKNIENYYLNPTLQNKATLLEDICFILEASKNYDCIVLGCTHFIFIKPLINQLTNLHLIDGNIGIANYLLINLNNLKIKPIKKYHIKILLSDKNQILAKKYKKILLQTLAK